MKKILLKTGMKIIDLMEFIYIKWNKIKFIISSLDYKQIFANLFEEKDKYIEAATYKSNKSYAPIINKLLFLLSSIFGLEEEEEKLILTNEKVFSYSIPLMNKAPLPILKNKIWLYILLLSYYCFMVFT